MALAEFELIDRFFRSQDSKNSSTVLGVGDDCALVEVTKEEVLAITTDSMVEGVHFSPEIDPEFLGYKALAVNLSDLAAMGAKPCWATLALTMPTADEEWLQQFSAGFCGLAEFYSLDLIGGDTTQGPLNITVQAMGLVPSDARAMLRCSACVGDSIYVTGRIGDSGLGLKILSGEFESSDLSAIARLHRPSPRVEAGLRIRSVANACIDVSDGLVSDLWHILKSSQVGATIFWENIPISGALKKYVETTDDWTMPLTAGDDYELCFTVPVANENRLHRSMINAECSYTRIGVIDKKKGLRVMKESEQIDFRSQGFVHF